MKKGWKIAFIVVAAFLCVCGVLFLVSYFRGNKVAQGMNNYYLPPRGWDNHAMPPGRMNRGDYPENQEDRYFDHWAAILGMSKDELKKRLDAGETLQSIAESKGIDLPCWDEKVEKNVTPTPTTTSPAE